MDTNKEQKPTAKKINEDFAKNKVENGEKVIGLDEKTNVVYLKDFGSFAKGKKRTMGVIKANFFSKKNIVKIVG